jgi:C4-dicarboxylate-specific signal transduction histidine kinase
VNALSGRLGPVALLALAVMAICLGVLLWVEGRVTRAIEDDIERIVAVFASSPALGEPQRAEGVRFRELEDLVVANQRAFLREIRVSKEMADGSEHLLWPLTGWHTDAHWRIDVADWRTRELRARGARDGTLLGHLYFDVDPMWVQSVTWAARGVGLLLVLTLLLLLSRLWGTSRRLEATTDALFERQRELIHLERLALAGQLSANMLHDLKKPVLNIRHGLTDLQQSLGDFSGPRRAIDELQTQTDLFQTILRETNLERFVQARDEEREFLDINDALRQAAALVRYEQADVAIEWDLTEGLPAVHSSRHRLVQVFSNLILNAFQAMEGKGTLTIRSKADGSGVAAVVEDTGPGIDPAVRGRLFEPFVTTKPVEEGAGLGLMICQMIVEEAHGGIEVLDGSGGGAAFRITLPSGDTAGDESRAGNGQ